MSDRCTEATLTWADPHAPSDERPPLAGGRYVDLGLLAVGGMGEVRRVRDQLLDCVVAMKILSPDRADAPAARARFIAEATTTARLRHPGIVAVHDRGERDDGRLWYTMTEVRGQTLTALLPELRQGEDGVRRLVAVLVQVCNALGYAHSEGVVHRDLKPDNVMIGPFGEVVVMDWGIAAPVGGPGDRAGTRGWSAPEQLRGAPADPRADVYSVGRILARALGDGEGPLHRIAAGATAGDPADRPSDAATLGARLQAWLDGAERRVEAEAILQQATEASPRIASLRQRAAAFRDRARAALEGLSADAEPEDKEPAWALEDEAAELDREAAVLEASWLQQVGAALERDPELPAAHQALADHHAAELLRAEAERRPQDAAQHEVHLRRHDRGRHARLLGGDGALTLVTDPPGAEVRLFRIVARSRRLVPEPCGTLGVTPLREVRLGRGSWVLELHHPGRAAVRYPVSLGRGEMWDGVRPGDSAPYPIVLPRLDALGPDDRVVPAGWFWCGGDPDAIEPLPRRRIWVDGLVVRRFPVTVGEFRSFLEDVAREEPEQAVALGPVARIVDGEGPITRIDGGVRFDWAVPRTERMPISSVPWTSAEAFAAWYAVRSGEAWRLPDEVEWEKSARGVDGRHYPDGDHLEARRYNVLDGSSRSRRIEEVGGRPADRSVYGIRDLVGNISGWCANGWRTEGAPVVDGVLTLHVADAPGNLRVIRGGSFQAGGARLRAATRLADPPDHAFDNVGLRLVRSLVSR